MFRKRKQHTWLSSNRWICDRPNNDRHDVRPWCVSRLHAKWSPTFPIKFTRDGPRLSTGSFHWTIETYTSSIHLVSQFRVSEIASGDTIDCSCIHITNRVPSKWERWTKNTRKDERGYRWKGSKIKEKTMFTTVIFALNTLWMVCEAVPLFDMRNSLEQNALDAIVSCSSNEDCWDWLSVQVHKTVPLISRSQNLPASK